MNETTGYHIDAGADQQIESGQSVSLAALTERDGVANSAWPVTWKKLEGPGTVTFTAPQSRATEASFSKAGTYVLEVEARDDALLGSSAMWVTLHDTLTVTVGEGGPDPLFADSFESGTTAWSSTQGSS